MQNYDECFSTEIMYNVNPDQTANALAGLGLHSPSMSQSRKQLVKCQLISWYWEYQMTSRAGGRENYYQMMRCQNRHRCKTRLKCIIIVHKMWTIMVHLQTRLSLVKTG